MMELLMDALVTIGTALIALLAAMAVRAINNYTAKLKLETLSIQDAQQSALVGDAISLAENLAITTVTAIEQTTAATLRQAVKDGKGTPAQMKQLAYDAAIQLQEKLSPMYLDALEKVYGDVNGYLVDLIEQKVWELKNLPTERVEV